MPATIVDEFRQPHDSGAFVWRYMDFTKFVSTLENEALYFSAANCLGDPLEGSFPRASAESRRRLLPDWSDHDHAQYAETFRQMARFTFVNCWHMNGGESAAMWRLYARTEEAVALRTTYRQLQDALDEECVIGLVRYLDYGTEAIHTPFSAFSPYIYKRRSFEHEREVRLIVQRPPFIDGHGPNGPEPRDYRVDLTAMAPTGIWKTVRMNDLIERIFVSPAAPSWFRELEGSHPLLTFDRVAL